MFAFCYLIEGKAIYLLVSVQLAKSLLCGLFTVKKIKGSVAQTNLAGLYGFQIKKNA